MDTHIAAHECCVGKSGHEPGAAGLRAVHRFFLEYPAPGGLDTTANKDGRGLGDGPLPLLPAYVQPCSCHGATRAAH